MTKFSQVLLAIGVAFVFCTLCNMLDPDPKLVKLRTGKKVAVPSAVIIAKSVILGIVVMILSMLTTANISNLFRIIVMCVCLLLMLYMVFWWKKSGYEIKEMIMFIIIDLVLSLTAVGAVGYGFPAWLKRIPWAFLIFSIGFFIANRFWFDVKTGDERIKIEELKKMQIRAEDNKVNGLLSHAFENRGGEDYVG